MADITKVLYDDHSRIRRAFDRYHVNKGNFLLAQSICTEIEVHAAIEEELVYPTIAEQLDEKVAERGETDHQVIDELVATVQELEPGDPQIDPLMQKLKKSVERHLAWEESTVFPLIKSSLRSPSPVTLGSQAFALRQQLLGQRPAPTHHRAQIVNTGWYTGSVPNAGW